jgi:geranylgeranyl pyrophosphate synthase
MKNMTIESVGMGIPRRNDRFEERSDTQQRSDDTEGLACLLPNDRRLPELLGVDDAIAVEDILKGTLLRPVAELISNPGKRVRAQLVAFSYRLLSGDLPLSVVAAKRCRSCAEVIELIHAASLIVDDIEDGSAVRRGRPALHARYGMPVALNAGNWLYFWPFELLKNLRLDVDDLVLVYECYHRTMLRAHFGQALDLGTRVDTLAQDEVAQVCLATMQLKTGALMGFATSLGGVLADASERLLSVLDDFGRDLGMALQMFDDLGNVIGKCEPSKRYEDLLMLRPSWVWACAAQNSSPADYRQFVAATRKLPEAGDLTAWINRHQLIEITRKNASVHLDRSFDHLKNRLNAERVRWSARVFDELRALGEEIAVAYG